MAAAPTFEETTLLSYLSHFSNVLVKDVSLQKGKGLFAKKDFREGELIFEEKPLICGQFLWNSLYKYTACSHCLRSLETAEQMARRLSGNDSLELPYASKCCEITRMGLKIISCHNCQVKYCSEECRQRAWDHYHRTLCLGQNEGDPSHPLEQLQESWRKMHYPPETASVMLIAQMIATVLQAPDPKKMQDVFESFCHSVVNRGQQIVHKLLGDQFKEQLDILRVQMSNALYDEKLEEWFKMEGFLSLMALVGINGQGIGTSSLSVYVHNLENLGDITEDERQALDIFIDQLYEEMYNVSGQFLNCEGSGLYALQSSCNPSCEPNAEVTFPHNNSTLVLKALHDIKEGEEIVICYLNCCDRERSRHSRQRLLRENYLFNCTCPKCESQSGDPDVTSSEDDDDSMEEDS
ncbi:SET and MYND domain-containing protein 5-like isoform X1 [Pocillopora damicornis]|uniref:SET and MYND domain-containing protein 5-like isoform X1 n=1 Tax=Pocillopora damicornis TaxID=46731 RepID=UPI000F54D938|nr:SET and MYND domain-containing protein 5-like isoform X1 [Pocillopora damicornis]